MPSGVSSVVTFTQVGTYCYSVAGRNSAVNLNFGSPSAQACVTVTAGQTACTPLDPIPDDYLETSTCANGGQYVVQFTYSPLVCRLVSTILDDCGVFVPPPPPACVLPRTIINGVCALPTTVCVAPQTLVNGVCTDPVVTTPTCTAPQVLVLGVCTTPTATCDLPNTVVNGVCTSPTATCTAPQVLVNGVCTDPPNPLPCPNGGVRLPNGQCPTTATTCDAPLVLSNGSCVLPCPLNTSNTVTCPSPTTGSFTETITYGALPLCTRSVSSNSATACVSPVSQSCSARFPSRTYIFGSACAAVTSSGTCPGFDDRMFVSASGTYFGTDTSTCKCEGYYLQLSSTEKNELQGPISHTCQ
jgi:hypothetical protein